MARIDRLADTPKRLLQTAALLGRDVSHWLLERLWDSAESLDTFLHDLQQLELLYALADTSHELVYRFKHALTQDVAYESIPPHHRQALHAMAGRALEARHAEHFDTALEPLAYHYARSAESDKAVVYLARQAERAVYNYAHVEAAALLQEALAHAAHLPESDRERCLVDLSLQRSLSLCFLGRFQEMLDLLLLQRQQVEHLQDPTRTGPYYFRLGLTCSCLGDYERGSQHAQHAVQEAQGCGDALTLGEASYVLSYAAMSVGRFAQGVEYGQQAMTLLEPTTERHWLATSLYVLALCYGYLVQFTPALEMAARFEEVGKTLQDPQLQSHAALAIAAVASMQGEWEVSLAAVQRCLASAPAAFTAGLAYMSMGQAYLEKADPVQAITILEPIIERYRAFRFAQGEGRAAASALSI